MLVTPPTHHVVMFPYTSKAAVLSVIQALTAVRSVVLLKESPTHSLGQTALTTARARNRAVIREKSRFIMLYGGGEGFVDVRGCEGEGGLKVGVEGGMGRGRIGLAI